jgi:hypothetical protein
MQGVNSKGDPGYLRGARSFIQGRFESVVREPFDDGWTAEEQAATELATTVTEERARSRSIRTGVANMGVCTACTAIPLFLWLTAACGRLPMYGLVTSSTGRRGKAGTGAM